MQERFIPPFVMLIAAAITGIINIINNVDKLTALKRLLLVIIIFYIVGLIARTVVKKALSQKPDREETEASQEITGTDQDNQEGKSNQ